MLLQMGGVRLTQGKFDFANIFSPQQLPLTAGFPKSGDAI
jgi:hypothetical protein